MESMVESPHNTYWVVFSKLLAGEYPRNKDVASSVGKLQAFIDVGVTHFIDLTEESELEPYAEMLHQFSEDGIVHDRFPIRDLGVPDSKMQMIEILDEIDKAIEQGNVVYVHCWGGVGRTGTVIGCYFARHGYQGQAALDELHRCWQHCAKSASRSSPETLQQIEYILRWNQ